MSPAVTTRVEWEERASTLTLPTAAYIGGAQVDAVSGQEFANFSPTTGDVLNHVASSDVADADRAVAAARAAFIQGDWANSSPGDRKKVLLRLADLIRQNAEELALLECLDMGKPISDALTVDVPAAAGVWQWHAEAIDKIYDEIAPTGPGDLAMVRREPLGVVAAVVPWNFPLDMAAWKCAPALATGNSVVLKPAEQSPLSALRLAELATEAGVPDGVFNVLPGFGETAGQALGRHLDVDCLAFTGSTEVGKYFLSYSAESNAKPVWLELGGKSPNVVFADAESLDDVAAKSAFGIFYNQGEVCSANSRLLVHRSVKDELLQKLVEEAERMAPGHPLDPDTAMGALVTREHTDRVMEFVESGRKSARLVIGGDRLTLSSDCYVTPTIFDDVSNDQEIARDEIFGPVLSVIAFDDESEAVRIANDTRFGLAASVWTSNLSRALRVAEQLKVGTVSVNTVDALSPMTPFGGFKQSGVGRDLSLHSFDKYTALKTTWISY
ncbi:MAG: aldehyde dehydrogenase [Actinomycetes bacterium]